MPPNSRNTSLAMLFLKRASDVFEERREQIIEEQRAQGRTEDEAQLRAEDARYYADTFYVPPQARWDDTARRAAPRCRQRAQQSTWRLSKTRTRRSTGVLTHIDFNRKVGKTRMPDQRLRELVRHFNKYRLLQRGLRVPRSARRRLRVSDRASSPTRPARRAASSTRRATSCG